MQKKKQLKRERVKRVEATYPSSFDKALSDAVEKRVAKVEESPFIEVT